MSRKLIQPDEKVPLKLTATERKLVLGDLMIMDQENEQAIRDTPAGKPVMMTLGDLDDFIGYIAAEANHTEDKRLERKLDRIYDKVQGLLDKFTEVDDDIIPIEEGRKRQGKSMMGVVAGKLFQFKITLLDIKPAIWRKIQVRDCTLGDLHEHIQTAMGWENYHLHQFNINGEQYGPPSPDDFDFGMETIDEDGVLLSGLLPKSGKKTRWIYEYDFGDGWRHEVAFEGYPPVEKGTKFPVCLEGERACPPEDCGGPWRFADYLEALANPKHEQHEELLEWLGPFDPEAFDVKKATKEMRKVK